MVTNLATLRQDPGYRALLADCEGVTRGVRLALEMLVDSYWGLGCVILKHEKSGDLQIRFGEATILCLAEDLRMSQANVYRARQFARQYPTQERYDQLKREMEANGQRIIWSSIKSNILPSPDHKPELYGGKAAVVDAKMAEAERLMQAAQELKELLHSDDVSLDQREQLVGVVQAMYETIHESQPVEVVSPPAKSATGYLDYIRSLPCAICDKTPADPHHVETGGVGMKGSDYVTIPLCRQHHDELHNRGRDSFQQWFGVDLYREVVRCLVGWLENGGM